MDKLYFYASLLVSALSFHIKNALVWLPRYVFIYWIIFHVRVYCYIPHDHREHFLLAGPKQGGGGGKLNAHTINPTR